MPGIKAVIADHFEILIRDMLDEKLDEIHSRNGLFDKSIILMPVIMESDVVSVIRVNSRESNDRTSEITSDIFGNSISVTEIGLGIDIETILVLFVDGGLNFFERGTDRILHVIKKSGLKSFAQISEVKMRDFAPEGIIRKTTFGEKTVNVRIPFKGTPESVQDTNKTGNKVLGFVDLEEHTQDNTADGSKKAVKERTVFKKEVAQILVNGKDTMPVSTVNELEGHGSSPVNRIFGTAGRTELGMTAKRDEFEFAAMRASIHGAAIRGIPTIDHLFDVFHDNRPRMKSIFNFFVVIFKNLLECIHKIIMKESKEKRNPTPQD